MNDAVNRIIKSVHLEAKRGSVIEGKRVIDWKRIKENCLKIAEELLIQTHQDKVPISLERICDLRKIRVSQCQYTITAAKGIIGFDFQGEIIPACEGFIVNLNSRHSDTRKRATLAHEIGHSLFYDISTLPPRRVYRANDTAEEWICWDFARSLLLPKLSVLEILSQYKGTPKPQVIYETAKQFEVSVDILLRRIRWDLGLWGDSTMFVGNFINGEFVVKDIHKGQSDKNITVKGKNGLINNNELKTFIMFLSINQKIYYLENKISTDRNSFWVELLRFNNDPISILGIIKKSRS